MFRIWTKNLGRVGKSEAHAYFLALTCSDAEQLGKPFLLKGNFINLSEYSITMTSFNGSNTSSTPSSQTRAVPETHLSGGLENLWRTRTQADVVVHI